MASTKGIRAGGEIDSMCSKCKLVLNHRIVAVDHGTPVRVECLTCHGEHKYRAPPSPSKGSAAAAAPKRERSTTPTRGGSAASRAEAKAEAARNDHEKTWESAIAGKNPRDFIAYNVALTFAEGDLVRHSKFGDGVIVRVLDAKKVEVLFRGESKTLAQALTD